MFCPIFHANFSRNDNNNNINDIHNIRNINNNVNIIDSNNSNNINNGNDDNDDNNSRYSVVDKKRVRRSVLCMTGREEDSLHPYSRSSLIGARK